MPSERVMQAHLDDLREEIAKRDDRIAKLEQRLDDADSASERRAIRAKLDREKGARDDVDDDADDLIERLRKLGVDIEEVDDDDSDDDDAGGKKKTRFVRPAKDDDDKKDDDDDDLKKKRDDKKKKDDDRAPGGDAPQVITAP